MMKAGDIFTVNFAQSCIYRYMDAMYTKMNGMVEVI
jgi:hypothetical protein